MSTHAQIEATQTISGKTVSAALEDHRLGLIVFHDGLDDRLEDGLVGDVINTVAKREIYGVILARTDTDIPKLAGAGEVLAVFMEGDSHDTVGGVKGFFYSVAVMDINIDI